MSAIGPRTMASDVKRLKALEEENAKHRRLYADALLDNTALEGSARAKMVTPAARRVAVARLVQAHEMGERRAGRLIGGDRSMIRSGAQRPDDATLRDRRRELAGERQRFGDRRLYVLLRRKGLVEYRERTQRIYREEGLSAKRRRGREKATGTRAPILVEAVPNARWLVDFVHDQLVSGRRLRILNVTKECLAAVVDTSISGRRVARELSGLIDRRGPPGVIVSDHGKEFTSNAMLEWTQKTGLPWHFIAPGKPMRNGIREAFNG